MILHFKKKLIHTNDMECHENYTHTISALCPKFKSSITGHITITHSEPFHEIWVTFYDQGKHENYSRGQTLSTNFNDIQKKYTGRVPTKTELEEL